MTRHGTATLGAVLGAVLGATLAAACSSAAPLPPDQLLAAFVGASRDGARTFHMESQSRLREGSPGSPPRGSDAMTSSTASFDFSGADYAGTVSTSWSLASGTQSGTGSTTAYAGVDGVDFARYEGAAMWERVESNSGLPINVDPTQGVEPADLAYVGPDTFDGRSVYRIDLTDPAAAIIRTLFPDNATPQQYTVEGAPEYAIFVDGRGVPVGARLTISLLVWNAPGESPGPTLPAVPYDLSVDYQFSEWGSPVVISAPAV